MLTRPPTPVPKLPVKPLPKLLLVWSWLYRPIGWFLVLAEEARLPPTAVPMYSPFTCACAPVAATSGNPTNVAANSTCLNCIKANPPAARRGRPGRFPWLKV